MRVVDLQNPLSNMPLMQQMQQSHNQQQQSIPIQLVHHFQQEVQEELTTVRQTKQPDEKDQVHAEEERDKTPRKRSRKKSQKEGNNPQESPKPRMKDGIHGRFLDMEV